MFSKIDEKNRHYYDVEVDAVDNVYMPAIKPVMHIDIQTLVVKRRMANIIYSSFVQITKYIYLIVLNIFINFKNVNAWQYSSVMGVTNSSNYLATSFHKITNYIQTYRSFLFDVH